MFCFVFVVILFFNLFVCCYCCCCYLVVVVSLFVYLFFVKPWPAFAMFDAIENINTAR